MKRWKAGIFACAVLMTSVSASLAVFAAKSRENVTNLRDFLIGKSIPAVSKAAGLDCSGDGILNAVDLTLLKRDLLSPHQPEQNASPRVKIEGKKFTVNGQELWINGCNTPWQNWNDFAGHMDEGFWDRELARLAADNINCTRIWINCNGEGVVQLDDSGAIRSINSAHWSDLDKLFALAEKHHVYLMPTLLSFDHFKSENEGGTRWQKMISDKANSDQFAEKYVREFAKRYDKCDYILGVDLMNEPDWVNETPECSSRMSVSYPRSVFSRFSRASR